MVCPSLISNILEGLLDNMRPPEVAWHHVMQVLLCRSRRLHLGMLVHDLELILNYAQTTKSSVSYFLN